MAGPGRWSAAMKTNENMNEESSCVVSKLNVSGGFARLIGLMCVMVMCVLPAYAGDQERVRVSGSAVL